MGYVINGEEKEVDDYGYLLEPDFSEEAVTAIAEAEAESALLFELFPDGGAAKQGCKVAGLPQPKGKGGY